jgi:hypothetical protein
MMPGATSIESHVKGGISGGGDAYDYNNNSDGDDDDDDDDDDDVKLMMNYYSHSRSGTAVSSPPLELYDEDEDENDDDFNYDDDGSDHANNDLSPDFHEIHRHHPQHLQQQHHHVTPHGNMTSILSAAGSYSPQKSKSPNQQPQHRQQLERQQYLHSQQSNNLQQQYSQTKVTTTAVTTIAMGGGHQQITSSSPSVNNNANNNIAAKRALRVRASKYFHRGGGVGGGGGVTTTTSPTSPPPENKCAASVDEREVVEFVDEKGVIRIMNHPTTTTASNNSSSSSSNATTALLSASTTSSPIPSGTASGATSTATASNTTHNTSTAAAKSTITSIAATTKESTPHHGNPSSTASSAISFFPRTSTSSSSSLLLTQNLIHHQQQQQHIQHRQQQQPIHHLEDNAGDPSLQTYLSPSSSYDNMLEVQSNATSGYTSGGGGSDLEVAARRILRGKKEQRGNSSSGRGGVVRHPSRRSSRNAGGTMSESENDDGEYYFTDDDDDDDDNNNNIGIVNLGQDSYNNTNGNVSHHHASNKRNITNNAGTGRASLPPGWRERIQRKTGIQLVKLPLSSIPSPVTSSKTPSPPVTSSRTTPSSNNIVSTAVITTDFSTAATPTTTNINDYSYCYSSDDNDDPCNQLGVYSSDGQLAMTKRVKNANTGSVAAATAAVADYDNDEVNDVIANEEWQHPRQQQHHQYYQHDEDGTRHPPTPSPTESIETTYHIEDLENNGAFPRRSHTRNHIYQAQRNGGYDGGNVGQSDPSVHWQSEHHHHQQHQQQQRLPILHEHHDQTGKQHYDVGNDDNSCSYDAEVEEEPDDDNDFDQNYYSHDNEEYNPDILTETRMHRDQAFESSGAGDDDDVGDNIHNTYHNTNNRSMPIIINEYGFPPINPDIAHFGDNYYVQEEGFRMSRNDGSISQRSRNNEASAVSLSSQRTGNRRVHFASSVVDGGITGAVRGGDIRGMGGGEMQVVDDNLDSDGFDDDEYFHRFYSNSTLTEEGPRNGQDKQYRSQQQRRRRRGNDGSSSGGVPTTGDWEVIPASPKVQWTSASSSRSDIRTSNINEINGMKTGDSDSAWSVPESTTSSMKMTDASTDTTAAKFDMFASPDYNGGDRQGTPSIPNLQKDDSKEKFMVELNSVIAQSPSRPPRGKSSKKSRMHQQRVNAFYDQWVKESKDAQLLSTRKQAEYYHSDGDLSDKGYHSTGFEGEERGTTGQKKKSLKLFKGRSRAYNSEGERSDTSLDGGRIKGSLSFNLYKKEGGLARKLMSPRRMSLFRHTNHHNPDINGDALNTWNEPKTRGGTDGSIPISALFNEAVPYQSSSVATIHSSSSVVTEEDIKEAITVSGVDASLDVEDSHHGSGEPQLSTIISHGGGERDEQHPMDSILNDSRETHTTPIVSNAKTQTRLRSSRPISIPPSTVSRRPPTSSSSKKLSSHSPKTDQTVVINDRIASQRKPGWTHAQVRTECNNDDETVSTLGSLVTKDTETRTVPAQKANAPFSSDASTVTELSEIERLRRENGLLREKLENASLISSQVSAMYAESLIQENNRLRKEYNSVSQLSSIAENHAHRHLKHVKPLDSIQRTTLETLLEKGNDVKMKKNRRRAQRDSPVADFNHLPPVAHLINGVDFDDDSIVSSYSIGGFHFQRKHASRGDGCETPEDLLKKTCSRIATTTRSVMKSALAQDPNTEFGAAPSSGPLNCFTTCRRDKSNDGTTVYVTEKQFNSARGTNMTRHHHSAAAAPEKSNRVSR